ncbi:protease synthase and sporulation negative regulatory PAI 1 domain protein [Levilactobacillus acidifarinae DSM 19394]|uniref:Protease synthase and sporulation negative regulatory PAI 1 domain protein n=1 Tax=Levilactobacillus acidifarinae DSM 19394 = JCM 15949 TaxID=1423715 RepID=A0A0R1LPT4_9LACO|nr:protease synthase and sporulation negative regulatory PAI 1 domain protein [Levilactobacillus acidifarinae DSM 19394]
MSRETFTATFGAQNTPADLATYLDTAYAATQLTQELENPASSFYFILKDQIVAGYLKLNTDAAQTEAMGPHALEIERIYLRPAFQKQGLGRHLFQIALDQAQRQRKTQIWLGVWEHNLNAQGFYHQLGFHQIGQHTFTLGSDPQTDLIYAKSL